MKSIKFQSTLPTRGSDPPYAAFDRHQRRFNPRSPRGGATIFKTEGKNIEYMFQSTLPTRGSDAAISSPSSTSSARFNPRSPRGGATKRFAYHGRAVARFNPRSPRGGATPFRICTLYALCVFQSTLPTRGSDSLHAPTIPKTICFNPRSPRGGATPVTLTLYTTAHRFNPRSPRGGATPAVGYGFVAEWFQSTLPTRGSD